MCDLGTPSPGALAESEVPVEVLVVAAGQPDYAALSGILTHPDWELHHIPNCREARAFLGHQPVAVVLSNAELPDGDWEDLVDQAENSPEPPSMIVFSRLADDRLWAEVLNLGGYDLLETPFHPAEVRRVAHAAWRNWKNNRERAVLGRKKPQSTAGSDPSAQKSLAAGAGG